VKIQQSGPRRPLVAAALSNVRGAFIGVGVLSGVTNLLMLTGPLFMLQVYDRVLTSRSVPTLVALSGVVIGLYVMLGLIEIIRSRVLVRIGQRLEEQVGPATFDAVLSLPLKIGNSEASAQPVRDLDQLRQFISGPGLVAICDLPWLPVYLAVVFAFHVVLGWVALAGAVFLVVVTLISEAALRRPLQEASAGGARRSGLIEAGRRNAEALRAMGMGGAYAALWRKENDGYLSRQAHASDLSGGFSAVTKVFRLVLQSAVLAVGAWLVIQQEMSGGVMIAASIVTSRALAPIEQALGNWRGFVAARQGRTRLQALLERLRDDREPMRLPVPHRSISVDKLTVAAPGQTTAIISDIGFRLEAGQGVGVIGPSGSGKSTLARALVGIWSPVRGTIRLDGAELDQWTPQALGPSIGYLPQGVELFDGTVAENISRLRPDASPDDVIAAAKIARVHDLILTLPDGYDTRIGSGGAILSAGQRQRVGLARALYGKPFLIVLDEPNASLDAEGEIALTNAIAEARQGGAVVVVIAHRPNALAAVDKVLVLANGRQTAFGPRDEVLRKTTVRSVQETA
jgi:ATP-binding cassette subfamily C protein